MNKDIIVIELARALVDTWDALQNEKRNVDILCSRAQSAEKENRNYMAFIENSKKKGAKNDADRMATSAD